MQSVSSVLERNNSRWSQCREEGVVPRERSAQGGGLVPRGDQTKRPSHAARALLQVGR